jgi:uncharacterized protein (DUF433 family)
MPSVVSCERLEFIMKNPGFEERVVSPARVESDINVMMGKPVIAGTRITVALILKKLGAGESLEQVLSAHPQLTREAIHAALAFAAEALHAGVVYPPSRGPGETSC